MRPIDEIVVHCSATRPEWMAGRSTQEKAQEIRRWHIQDRGWIDIGYHYVIDRDGTVVSGRPVERVGAHVMGHNLGTIGVCLIGAHEASAADRFEEHFTEAQDRILRGFLAQLRREHPGVRKISGHNEYAAVGCPGFRVGPWLERKPAAPARRSFFERLLQWAFGTR